jgi:hypothetical protein
MNQHRKRQVLAPFTLPTVCATALSSRLIVGHNHHVALTVFLQPAVRRVRFFYMNNPKIHNPLAKLRKKM